MTQNYYTMRKDCRCPGLDGLWTQVGSIDALLHLAEQNKNSEIHSLMLGSAVDDYKEMVADLVFNGKVEVKDGDRKVSSGQLHKEDPFAVSNERYRLYCKACETEVPKIHID